MSDHYVSTWRKAAKSHRCELCNRDIEKGERYLRSANISEGTAWTWIECAHCDSLRDLVVRQSGLRGEGYGPDLIGEWDPPTIGLLRLKAMWQKSWRNLHGDLYPVPEKVMADVDLGDGFMVTYQVDAKPVEP